MYITTTSFRTKYNPSFVRYGKDKYIYIKSHVNAFKYHIRSMHVQRVWIQKHEHKRLSCAYIIIDITMCVCTFFFLLK